MPKFLNKLNFRFLDLKKKWKLYAMMSHDLVHVCRR